MSIESRTHEIDPWQRYRRSEIWLHLLFFIMAASVLLMSVLMTSEGEKSVFLPGFRSALPDTCTSRRVFGIDCPGCGMTRAFISISKGQFTQAWQFNPASFAVYLFIAVQIPWQTLQLWRLTRNQRPFEWGYIYLLPIGVVFVMLATWIWKLIQML